QVQTNAQDFVRPEPGDEAYLPNYLLVEQYFPSVDAAVEYANANFNIDIHADFYVTMDENGAYVYYELLEDVEEPEEPAADPEEPDPDPEEPDDNIYVVQSGDYLYRIANEFGITVDNLIDWNNLESNSLFVGQELIVVDPDNGAEEPDPGDPEDIIYVVEAGDYLYRIAAEFGVTVQDIIDWNNLESDALQVGDQLIIRQ